MGPVPVTTPTFPVDEMLGALAGRSPALVKFEMSEADYLALGETKHTEYYDGMCVVNPPKRRHQAAELNLVRLLSPVIPRTHIAYVEWGWGIGGEYFRPDVMVIPRDGPEDLQVDPPLLVVEVLSRSTRLDDLITKRDKYAAGGLQWYWAVDIDEPSIVVMRALDGVLTEVQRLDGPGRTAGPVEVDVDPVGLGAEQ